MIKGINSVMYNVITTVINNVTQAFLLQNFVFPVIKYVTSSILSRLKVIRIT